MTDQVKQFDVLVSGQVLSGWDSDEVTAAFARLIKMDVEKAADFFRGQPRLIKKSTDEATAKKFEKALTGIGVDTRIRPLEEENETSALAGLSLAPIGEEATGDGGGAEVKKPGSSMLCPGCHTLQPRQEQCPACGIFVEKAKRHQQAG